MSGAQFDSFGDGLRLAYREDGSGDDMARCGFFWLGGFMSEMTGGKAESLAGLARDSRRPSLRFDYRGMGDSDGDARSFEAIDADIAAAVDVLCRESSVARVVLWGLCDGASAALMYAPADPRIAGIVALNPWARSVQGEATVRLKHYYVKRLLSVEFWRKVATGGFNVRRGADDFAGAISGALRSDDRGTSVPFLRRMEEGWGRFGRPTLFLLSGNDLTAREFEDWVAASAHRRALLGAASTELAEFPEADHTFSSRALRDAVAARTIEWIGRACRPS